MQQDERWQKIEELFNQAIQFPISNRKSFVMEQYVDDPELCSEVVSLLAADNQSNEIFNESVFPLVAQLLCKKSN